MNHGEDVIWLLQSKWRERWGMLSLMSECMIKTYIFDFLSYFFIVESRDRSVCLLCSIIRKCVA